MSDMTPRQTDTPKAHRSRIHPLRFLTRLFDSRVAEADMHENSQSKATMMTAAEAFHSLRVEDVMVPRADITAIELTDGLHDIATAFIAAGHSRLPVYKETLDDPLGMAHIKDVLPFLMLDAKGRSGETYAREKIISKIQRPVLFVPPSMQAQDLLRRMQARRIHMAIVVDEYGGTDGLVTLEDLVEPIVGDIEDEHDSSEPEVRLLKDKDGHLIWDADARITIDDFESALGRDFATPDEEEDVDTLGGLVFTLAGRVPERGEVIRHPDGIEFEVTDADPRRVKRLRIQVTSVESAAQKSLVKKNAAKNSMSEESASNQTVPKKDSSEKDSSEKDSFDTNPHPQPTSSPTSPLTSE